MSDLHDAIQALIAAHRPDRVPPFALIERRKRIRDRRRRAGGAVAAAAAATAVALAPSYLLDAHGASDSVTTDTPVSPAADTGSCAGDVAVDKLTGTRQTVSVSAQQTADLTLNIGDSLQITASGPCGSTVRPSLPPSGPLMPGASDRFVIATARGTSRLELMRPACDEPVQPACRGGVVAVGSLDVTVLGPVQRTDCRAVPDFPLEASLVGLPEADAAARYSARTISREGVCQLITADLNPNRLNIIIDHGLVVWAGRF